MNKAYYWRFDTALGEMYVASSDVGLCKVKLVGEDIQAFFTWLFKHFDAVEENFERNANTVHQLVEYTKGNLKSFQVDLDFIGTPFQKKVWQTLMTIPYGKVCSYKDIALQVGCPKGFRAVGMANNKNNIPIIVPCHRIIGGNGELVGYGGGLDMKMRLLELEGRRIQNGKVVTEK